ncbi:MAG: hypothetical protein ACKVOQ_15760 [Cyclobacteriaceae bacterium]
MYTVNYDNEEYKYEVKISNTNKQVIFEYRIIGGSKILSGFYRAPNNGGYNYKESRFTIPGSLVEGNFEPYFLINKVNFNKLKSMKWGDEFQIEMNNKSYTITASGEDEYTFVSKENEGFVRAMYFTFVEDGKNGSLILGTGLNKQTILELSLEGSYKMKLDSIK